MKRITITLLILSLFHLSYAQNWTQFRSSSRDGKASATQLLDKWPDAGPEKCWKIELGSGFSEVVVKNGIMYLVESDTLKKVEFISVRDVATAKELWKSKIDSMYYEVDGWGHGSRATPAVDDERVYCFSGFGKLVAFSVKNGKELWKVDVASEYESTMPRWGYASSPLLIDDVLILETGGKENKAFTAFNIKNGDMVWTKGIGVTTYNSPAIATIDGKEQIVFANDTMVHAYLSDGTELWNYRMPLRSPTPMPVFIEPNKFFFSAMGRAGCFVIEVNDNKVNEVMKSRTMQNNFNSSCYYDGYLYGITRAKLMCISAETGELQWSQRGFGAGSLIIVNDRLLVLTDQGLLYMIKATPESYQELSKVQAIEGKSWTAPSFADGKIFVRNLEESACFTITKQ